MTRKKRQSYYAVIGAGAGLLIVACGVTHVSFSDAEALSAEYFRAQANGDVGSTMSLYSSEFATEDFRPKWETFLEEKGVKLGALTKHTPLSERFAPRISGTATGRSDVCFIMTYSVTYTGASTEETLTIEANNN